MKKRLNRLSSSFLILALLLALIPTVALADNTAQSIPFSQNWSNTGLITTNDDWSGVPGIVGYRGDGLASTGNDPQTILADGSATPVDVNANQTNPNTFTTGGVSEFEITDPVVALQGSGTADAPQIVIYLNTTGQSNISISYNVRDIDGSADNAVQQVALQYRVGNTGNFTNLPAGYIADATTGPNLATLVTPVNVLLPSDVDNQPDVQIRILTTDASGSDEWVGIDDILVTASGGGPTPGQSLPLIENFDDCTLAGWEIISIDPDTSHTWSCSASFSNIDANGFGDTSPADEWLITPPLNLDAQDGDTLTFRNYTNYTDVDYPQLHVLYSTNYDGGGDPTGAAWTELTGITYSPEGSGSWVDSGDVDLSGISGNNVYVAFRYVSSGTGSGSAANWRLDSINIFEKVTPPPSSNLVINEIMQNPAAVSDANGEWFELYNAGDSAVDINGWTIADNDIDNHVIDNGGPLLVPAGGYLVLGNNTDTGTNGGVTLNYNYGDNWFLANGADEVVLFDGTMAEIDRVEYDGGPVFPDPNGASMALSDPTMDNNVGVNWCTASTPYGDGDLGTPGAANDCPPPNIVINEIMQNPAAVSDGAGEWFELYNPGGSAVDINGWTIEDNGSDSHVINNGGPLLVLSGGYLVLGNNTNSATNGGVTVDYGYGGSWFLANGDDEVILLDGNLTEIDRVEYDGGPAFPDPNGASMQLKDADLDNNVGANWCEGVTAFGAGDLGTPGADNICEVFIHEVQGTGSIVTITKTVLVTAIVVGDYQTQGSGQLRGFFIQEEDADADADPATSEGIFVYCGSCSTAVNVGDKVQVIGEASDYFGMSQLTATSASSVTVVSSGNPLPTPASVELPVPGVPGDDLTLATNAIDAYFEAFEGMLVAFPDTLSISEYFELARYGQLILTEGGRPRQFTDANTPTEAGYINHQIDLASRTIILDDTDNRQNRPVDTPNTAYYYPVPGLSAGNFFRGGDTITNLTGVLHWSYAGQSGTDAWRIRPVTEAYSYAFTSDNPRSSVPDVGGSLKVASFNVLNYFLTVDTTSSSNVGDCGPSGDLDCRGADSSQELDRQRAKLLAALQSLDADVIGLIEMENTTGVEPLADIVAGLSGYAYIDTGTIGTDAIRVGLIYKTATVQPVGNFAILDSTVDPRFIDTRNRPALAQTFEEIVSGGRFTVAVNHLKSKGSGCGLGDDDTTTGQGNCNGTRTQAAIALADWLATDPTGSGDDDVLIIGDLNSYAKEDPIVALENAGFTNLVAAFGGSDAYSYVFDGQLGYLDHALSNANLTPQVTGVAEWHINADEVPLFDYNDDVLDVGEASYEEESDALPLYEANAYRTSDHDPVIIGLNLLHYDFSDFFRPVNPFPAVNKANAGSSVPVKFSLNGDRGIDIFVAGYPKSQQMSCDFSSAEGIEETETAGGSSLSYDPLIDQYNYVWKTDELWAGTCRQLIVKFRDGTTYYANFTFK